MSESIHCVNDKSFKYALVEKGEYFVHLVTEDPNDVILLWHNSMPVNVISTHVPLVYESYDLRTINIVQDEANHKAPEKYELAKKCES